MENTITSDPTRTKPKTTPKRKTAPGPIRRSKPSVDPKPKA